MKFLHISDLHIGKRLNKTSLLEDQSFILDQIASRFDKEDVDTLLIAGDLYDQIQPSREAVALVDRFLTRVSTVGKPVFVVAGNHDSAQLVSYGKSLFNSMKLYMSSVYDGTIEKVLLSDSYGEIFVWLIPYLNPSLVKPYFPDKDIKTHEDSLKAVIESLNIDTTVRNVALSHQFVTEGSSAVELSESEIHSVGGIDSIDASVYRSFDYVALGHLHKAQSVLGDTIRYSGTPLKYSLSEANHQKSMTLVELNEKGEISVELEPLPCLRDMVVHKGTMSEIKEKLLELKMPSNEFAFIRLSDSEISSEDMQFLRWYFPHFCVIEYDQTPDQNIDVHNDLSDKTSQKSPLEHFSDFFALQTGAELDDYQFELMSGIFSDLIEEQV